MNSADLTTHLVHALGISERLPVYVDGAPGDSDTELVSRFAQTEQISDYLMDSGSTTAQLTDLLRGISWAPQPGSTDWIDTAAASLGHRCEDARSLATRSVRCAGTLFPSLPLPGLFGDLGDFYICRLRDTLSTAQIPEPADDVFTALTGALLDRLAEALLRPLLNELADQRAGLIGATPRDRYNEFDAALRTAQTRAQLAARYPVALRDSARIGLQWVREATELLGRFTRDAARLCELGLLMVPQLASISLHLGDFHHDGRAVAILTDAEGGRVVYKPSDHAIVGIYREIVDLLSDGAFDIQCPVIWNRSGYAWSEYIGQAGAAVADPAAYYRSFGAAAAVAYVLGATDLHLENVIATAHCPVPVDLETIVQNRSWRPTAGRTAAEVAADHLNNSVLAAGYLPVRVGQDDDQPGLDVSVLTGGLGKAPNRTAFQVSDPYTDTMRIELGSVPVGSARNQLPGIGLEDVRRHRDQVLRGFTAAYRILLAHKSEVLEMVRTAPNSRFRHIVRPTRLYSLLLHESRRAELCASGVVRDHLFNQLWSVLESQSHVLRSPVMVAVEHRALGNGDVPLFYAELDGTALWSGDRVVVEDHFDSTARNELLRRIESLSDDDLTRQAQMVREAIVTGTAAPGADKPAKSEPIAALAHPGEADVALVERFRALAVNYLVDTAFRGDAESGADATWIGVCSSADNSVFEYRPLGTSLYDGLAGVGLALTYAGAPAADLARHALRPVHEDVTRWVADQSSLPVGAFSGISGLLYALLHNRSVARHDEWDETIAAAIRLLAKTVQDDPYLDISSGAAGVCAVFAVESNRDDPHVRDLVRCATDQLTRTATRLDDGTVAWPGGNNGVLLGGFSHGASGIGWALARAAVFLGDDSLRALAVAALNYEDRLYSPTLGRWRDARPELHGVPGREYPAHWCHGVAGIGLARMESGLLLGEEEWLAGGLQTAHTLMEAGLPSSDSLCHGSLGNYETVGRAVELDPSLIPAGRGYRHLLLRRLQDSGVTSGVHDSVNAVPGLMLGWSGILLGLLRMSAEGSEQNAVPRPPNILTLDPPAEDSPVRRVPTS